ncbi:MAG: hypothetical protein KIS86_09555 [Devosia sp.]|nr:hypothetical protein [Devosia sp.]
MDRDAIDVSSGCQCGAVRYPDRQGWWSAIKASNHQHTDHDTAVWPPQ